MIKYYYEEASKDELANEDSPLKFVIFEENDSEDIIIAWCYEKEFAKKLVNTLNNYTLLTE